MKRITILLSVLLAAYALGCVTVPAVVEPAPTPAPIEIVTPTGAGASALVVVGLIGVDPKAYGGWDGECPGCDVDAIGLYNAATARGIPSTLLLNNEGTWARFVSSVLAAAKPLKVGDRLTIAMSGHGGQMDDQNGDEPSGKDSTLCMWDGQVRDDQFRTDILLKLPAGLEVLLISDQCHSEGSFRWYSPRRWFGAREARQMELFDETTVKSWDLQCQVIQLAGCREASYSYGGANGGAWTQTLLPLLGAQPTVRQWFDRAAVKMGKNQKPVWVEGGPVTDAFRNGPALK